LEIDPQTAQENNHHIFLLFTPVALQWGVPVRELVVPESLLDVKLTAENTFNHGEKLIQTALQDAGGSGNSRLFSISIKDTGYGVFL
jgi:hypothetical protein